MRSCHKLRFWIPEPLFPFELAQIKAKESWTLNNLLSSTTIAYTSHNKGGTYIMWGQELLAELWILSLSIFF